MIESLRPWLAMLVDLDLLDRYGWRMVQGLGLTLQLVAISVFFGFFLGLVAAAPGLMRVLAKAHQFLTFTTPPNLQVAVAYGLGKPDAWFADMRAELQASRDYFAKGLVARGFSVLPSAGTYFVNIDIAPLGMGDDVAFCKTLVEQHGVAAIPVSAFYAQTPVRHVVRFCFAKHRATLDAALQRLEKVAG